MIARNTCSPSREIAARHQRNAHPDARLYRKGDGQGAELSFMGHILMENRNALIVETELTQASGTAERDATLAMIDRHSQTAKRITLDGDKGFDVTNFIGELRERNVTPHIAVDAHLTKTGKARKTAIDGRTTRHPGYTISQRFRKRIEEGFGYMKTVAVLRKTRHRGTARVGFMFTLAAPPTISCESRSYRRPCHNKEAAKPGLHQG
jgi:DDE family transposase